MQQNYQKWQQPLYYALKSTQHIHIYGNAQWYIHSNILSIYS